MGHDTTRQSVQEIQYHYQSVVMLVCLLYTKNSHKHKNPFTWLITQVDVT